MQLSGRVVERWVQEMSGEVKEREMCTPFMSFGLWPLAEPHSCDASSLLGSNNFRWRNWEDVVSQT